MKKLLWLGCLLVAAACEVGESVEPVRFADGTQTQAKHWDDRWLVINYWAEWCGPCRHEIPELNALHAKRGEHNLVMLGVNYDGLSGEKLAEVSQRMDVKFPTLADDPFMKYGYERPMQLPVTVLIDPSRQLHDVLLGPQTASSIMAAMSQ